jgi:hypothetical protein
VQSISLLEFELIPSSYVDRKFTSMIEKSQQKSLAKWQSPEGQLKIQKMKEQYEAAVPQWRLDHPGQEPPPWQNPMARFDTQPVEGATPPSDFQMNLKIKSVLGSPPEALTDRIRQPIQSIIWDYSQPWAKQSSELLRNWLPQTELFIVPKRDHWYTGENTKGLASGMLDFFSRHPLA